MSMYPEGTQVAAFDRRFGGATRNRGGDGGAFGYAAYVEGDRARMRIEATLALIDMEDRSVAAATTIGHALAELAQQSAEALAAATARLELGSTSRLDNAAQHWRVAVDMLGRAAAALRCIERDRP